MQTDSQDLLTWALFARISGLNHERVAAALQVAGTARAIPRLDAATLTACGFPPASRQTLEKPDWAQAEADLRWLCAPDRWLLGMDSPLYPEQLAHAPGAPVALYLRGDPHLLTRPQLAIVGSRNPTASGRANARRFAAQLSDCRLIVTSGMAEGIDGASHEGALSTGAPTIAVWGSGLDRLYPRKHAALAERIAARGVLVSELPPDTEASKTTFPRRNRIISGLSLGVLVVEAAERSGSLITARFAAEQGREVFAIPGSIHNPLTRGCHALIRQGAKLVENIEDILDELLLPRILTPASGAGEDAGSGTAQEGLQAGSALDKEFEILLDALGFDPVDQSVLIERSGLRPETVASLLLMLELRGEIESRPGGLYCLLHGGAPARRTLRLRRKEMPDRTPDRSRQPE